MTASRLVVSSECLRHWRDEGAAKPHQGNIFGVPVDIDFSWQGDAFAITSPRLSLAEIVTQTNEATSSKEGGEPTTRRLRAWPSARRDARRGATISPRAHHHATEPFS